MDKKTLTSLFAESLFQIPDYQRGYAWEKRQLNDFIQDVDALVAEQKTKHYTGTIVVYANADAKVLDYGTKRMKVVDVVDGQQRLTTCCLYLSVIINALVQRNQVAYERDISDFLYSGAVCKLTLNNDTGRVFYDLLKTGQSNTPPQSPHEIRLTAACAQFQRHIKDQLREHSEQGTSYLKELHHAITQRLHFTFYEIEEECEIGMTFELMNSRGKALSVMELLKNYLMYWVSRNEPVPFERKGLTQLINNYWTSTYANLGVCSGDEDQCLRIAWTLLCNHTPANWIGYDGFKGDNYIPLRISKERTKEIKDFILKFTGKLAEISKYYAIIVDPTPRNTVSSDELLWLTKMHQTGNVANFLPLLVATRMHLGGSVSETEYIGLLQALECYAYRVFLYEGRRSNAGKSSFYRWGYEIFTQNQKLPQITEWVYELIQYYAPEESFNSANAKPSPWYNMRNLLKYTLFEYELHLLEVEGKGKKPHLKWEELSDSTIEHILPQNPDEKSDWKGKWSSSDFAECLHDIANLVLTQNNSNYSNFDFSRKKGKPGLSPSYSNSDIRQERKLSLFTDWTRKEFDQRRAELEVWINKRWKTVVEKKKVLSVDIVDEQDEDRVQNKVIAPREGFSI